MSGIPDPAERKNRLVPLITTGILQRSREVAQQYLDEALSALHRAGVKTEELAWIPQAIASQLDNRF
jgi:glycosyltransferase A (GT-A) superfamily protein (DUF2064 family)